MSAWVRRAVDEGTLDPERLAAFAALRHELAVTDAQRSRHEQRRRDRSFTKLVREVQRIKRGRR